MQLNTHKAGAPTIGAQFAGKRFLTRKQLAGYLGLSVRTLDRYYKRGSGGPPVTRLSPHRIAYEVSAVEAWAAARSFKHKAEELSRTAS